MEKGLNTRIKEITTWNQYKVVCDIPKNMLMELTNCCNNTCLFCANSKSTKKRGFIETATAKKILKEAYDLGVREVGFYGGTGEPLLDNHLEEYISYAKDLGYEYTYITTNGALLNKERANAIIKAGLDSIKLSINAVNREMYQMIHGKDEFELVMDNLKYLHSLKQDTNNRFRLYVSYVASRYTDVEQKELEEVFGCYVDEIGYCKCNNVAGYMSEELRQFLSVGNYLSFHPEGGICPLPFKTLYISYEGYLTMCCADFQNYLVVADLKEEKLEDAWNNQYARKLRERHIAHEIEGTRCFNCMNACNEQVMSLREEYAVLIKDKEWLKCDEIEKRINTMGK